MNLDRFETHLKDRIERYKKRYKNQRIVALKIVYYILSNLFKIQTKVKPSNTWYKVGAGFDDNDKLSHTLTKGWNIPNAILKSDEHFYFSIDRALKMKPDLKGVWLVFFMGIGDYFNASAFIEQLRKTYPTLEFNAFVSKNVDGNNSPLVADILKTNPNISRVEFFDGYQDKTYWENYDCSDCYDRVADDYLLIPVVYEYEPHIISRHITLCETFSLPVPPIIPMPKIYPYNVSEELHSLYSKINDAAKNAKKGVVFIQASSRSTVWEYPYTQNIVENLLRDNYVVVTVEKCNIKHSNYFEINTKKFNINESIELLRLLKKTTKLSCITLNSCFWAISAGLGIPNLGLQHRDNPSMLTEYFPNIYCITNRFIKGINPSYQFITPEAKFEKITWLGSDLYIHKPEFVYECFKCMKERVCSE